MKINKDGNEDKNLKNNLENEIERIQNPTEEDVKENFENKEDYQKENSESEEKEIIKKDNKKSTISKKQGIIFNIIAFICIALFSIAISPKCLQGSTLAYHFTSFR